MCGIYGIISKEKTFFEEATKIEDTLKTRGPDNTGTIKIKNSIIGNTRLAVVDQDQNSNQPFFSKSKNTIIVFNGEIYNYQELKQKYNIKTVTNSDTEVFVELFEKIGKKTFQEIEGMYAACIYSYKDDTFCLTRDSIGIKPLYYFIKNNVIFFSSEIKGILNTNQYNFEINYDSVIDFISFGLLDHSKNTFFKNIFSLEAGEVIEINNNNEINSKKNIEYLRIANNYLDHDNNHLKKLFEEELTKSLIKQSNTVRSLGTHLSGGIDSSLVTAMLKEQKSDIKTYTFGYEEEEFDERQNAKKVSEELNLINKSSLLKFEDIDKLFLKTLKVHDEPFTSLRQLSHLKIYLDYKEESTVILEASGGDEIGAGYRGFIWPFFMDSCLKNGFEKAFDDLRIFAKSRNINNLERFISQNSLNMDLYGLCTSDGTYASGIKYINDKARIFERAKYYKQSIELPFDSHLRNAQFLELSKTKLPRGLRYIDRSSSAAGKEARVPLLSNQLVGIGLAIGAEYKLDFNSSRIFMTNIAKNKCEFLINNKLKKDIADPQGFWMKTKLSFIIKEVFNSERFQKRDLFNCQILLKDFENYINNQSGFHSLQFFNIFIFEIWTRFFIESSQDQRDDYQSLSEFIYATNK